MFVICHNLCYDNIIVWAGVMELADVQDSKSCGGNTVWVRPPSPAPIILRYYIHLGGFYSMQQLMSLAPLLILIIAMYFLMIRPQRKKDKQIQEMRNNLQVGDEIVTIGGICGKIVKTKDETIGRRQTEI